MSRYSFALSLKIPNIEPIYKGIFKFKHVKDNIYACAWSKNNDDNYIIGEWNGKWSGTDKIFIGTFINFNNKNKIEGTWVGQWDNDLDENKEFIGTLSSIFHPYVFLTGLLTISLFAMGSFNFLFQPVYEKYGRV